ncbi:MAG: fatty acid desaturase [Bacteriovoracaceae bacterium]|nr:fatty acid desaturase [Bacteriovoracaceae bacterium]
MVLKTCLYLGSFAVTYTLILTQSVPAWSLLGLCFFLGLLTTGIGFNIGHDAIHGAYSEKPLWNKILGYSFVLLGADVHNWKVLHNIIHHSYTNIPEADGDLHPVPFLRFSPGTPKKKMHKYQHYYALFLYGLTSLMWVFKKDYVHIRKKQHLIYKKRPATSHQYRELVFFKVAYYFAFLILPLAVLPFAWWQILLGFFVMHLAAGFTLAIVFQLGHIVEGPEFPSIPADRLLKDIWLTHQLRTASNFATNSRVGDWLYGGLNFQIEHHLFPGICHVHYRAIAPIVRATAVEFDLPYYEQKTFFSAVKSHLRLLKSLGS